MTGMSGGKEFDVFDVLEVDDIRAGAALSADAPRPGSPRAALREAAAKKRLLARCAPRAGAGVRARGGERGGGTVRRRRLTAALACGAGALVLAVTAGVFALLPGTGGPGVSVPAGTGGTGTQPAQTAPVTTASVTTGPVAVPAGELPCTPLAEFETELDFQDGFFLEREPVYRKVVEAYEYLDGRMVKLPRRECAGVYPFLDGELAFTLSYVQNSDGAYYVIGAAGAVSKASLSAVPGDAEAVMLTISELDVPAEASGGRFPDHPCRAGDSWLIDLDTGALTALVDRGDAYAFFSQDYEGLFLSEGSYEYAAVTFSADGRYLAYATKRNGPICGVPGYSEVYIKDRETGEEWKIPDGYGQGMTMYEWLDAETVAYQHQQFVPFENRLETYNVRTRQASSTDMEEEEVSFFFNNSAYLFDAAGRQFVDIRSGQRLPFSGGAAFSVLHVYRISADTGSMAFLSVKLSGEAGTEDNVTVAFDYATGHVMRIPAARGSFRHQYGDGRLLLESASGTVTAYRIVLPDYGRFEPAA